MGRYLNEIRDQKNTSTATDKADRTQSVSSVSAHLGHIQKNDHIEPMDTEKGFVPFRAKPKHENSKCESGKYLDQIKKGKSTLVPTDNTDKRPSVSSVSAPSEHIHKSNFSKSSAFWFRLTDNPSAVLTMISPGANLKEAREILTDKFGGRLIEVWSRKQQAHKKC